MIPVQPIFWGEEGGGEKNTKSGAIICKHNDNAASRAYRLLYKPLAAYIEGGLDIMDLWLWSEVLYTVLKRVDCFL